MATVISILVKIVVVALLIKALILQLLQDVVHAQSLEDLAKEKLRAEGVAININKLEWSPDTICKRGVI